MLRANCWINKNNLNILIRLSFWRWIENAPPHQIISLQNKLYSLFPVGNAVGVCSLYIVAPLFVQLFASASTEYQYFPSSITSPLYQSPLSSILPSQDDDPTFLPLSALLCTANDIHFHYFHCTVLVPTPSLLRFISVSQMFTCWRFSLQSEMLLVCVMINLTGQFVWAGKSPGRHAMMC